MFGTPSNQSPFTATVSAHALLAQEEIQETLLSLGFITSPQGLLPEDYSAVANRKEIIQKKHPIASELAITLAYIDRMILVEKDNQEAVTKLLAAIDTDLVAALVERDDDLLAGNEEFLQTVATTARATFNSGAHTAFSDALFAAVKAREEAIAATPVLEGKIDAHGTVLGVEDQKTA